MPVVTTTDFSAWLTKMMADKGLSNNDLARLADISGASVWSLLNETRKPGTDVAKALARALGVSQVRVFVEAGLLDAEAERELNERLGDPNIQEALELFDRLREYPEAERFFVEHMRNTLKLLEAKRPNHKRT